MEDFKNNIAASAFKYDSINLIKELERPYRYLTRTPTPEGWRLIIKMVNHWAQAPKEIEEATCDIFYLLHNIYNIFDDIEDNSNLRRGQPSAHTVFGIPHTLLSIVHCLFVLRKKMSALNHPEIMSMIRATYLGLLRGVIMEIYWRENFICPTEEEYKLMVSKKAGLFILLPCSIIQLFATKDVDTNTIIWDLTMHFQVNDDHQNLKSNQFSVSKGFCEDFSEGKFTLPTIHAIKNCPEVADEISAILRQKTRDINIKRKGVALLEKCGSFEYCKKNLENIKLSIFEQYKKLGYNPYFESVLQLFDGTTCIT